VVGEVEQGGGFVLNDQESLSALQALGGRGITKSASLNHARFFAPPIQAGPVGDPKWTCGKISEARRGPTWPFTPRIFYSFRPTRPETSA